MIGLPKRLALCVVLALGLAACSRGTQLPPTAAGGNGDAPTNFQLVTDIPIPSGATMDNDRSLILSDRDRWTGRVVMSLLFNSANEVTSFYQQQMPNFGWQPVMSVTGDTSVMTYVRGDRAATVQVERRTVMGAIVSVTVAPKQSDTTGAAGGYDSAPMPRPAPAGSIKAEPLR